MDKIMTTTTNPSDTLRDALLRNLSDALAHEAAAALEPLAGQAIGDDARAALGIDVFQVLARRLPALLNARHALDAP